MVIKLNIHHIHEHIKQKERFTLQLWSLLDFIISISTVDKLQVSASLSGDTEAEFKSNGQQEVQTLQNKTGNINCGGCLQLGEDIETEIQSLSLQPTSRLCSELNDLILLAAHKSFLIH